MTTKTLAQRMLRDELLELRGKLGVATESEVGVDPLLERGQPQLVEAVDRGLREALVAEVGEGRTAPERERFPENRRRTGRVPALRSPPSSLRETLEASDVEGVLGDDQRVAPGPGLERAGRAPEQLPQGRDVDVQAPLRSVGVVVAPDRVEGALGRHDLVRVQEQEGKERSLLGASEGDRSALDYGLERPQQAELNVHAPILIVL